MPGGERGDRGGRSGGALQRTTGRDRDEWFGVLDAWGAARRPYREIAEWLTGSHGLSAWWAQKLIVEFEEERGLRPTGICSNGTFEVGARKMIAVPAQRAFEALADAGVRNAWLPGVRLDETASEPGRSVRFEAGGRVAGSGRAHLAGPVQDARGGAPVEDWRRRERRPDEEALATAAHGAEDPAGGSAVSRRCRIRRLTASTVAYRAPQQARRQGGYRWSS